MDTIYVIECRSRNNCNNISISGDGYEDVEDAIAFIKQRSDSPQLINKSIPWVFYGEHNIYSIKSIVVRPHNYKAVDKEKARKLQHEAANKQNWSYEDTYEYWIRKSKTEE